MTRLQIAAVVAFSVGLVGFAAWRTVKHDHLPHPAFGVVVDQTVSHAVDRPQACLSVVGIVEQIATSDIADDTHLTVLALGDGTSSGEPVQLLDNGEPVPTRATISAGQDVVERQRHDYLVKLYAKCVRAPNPEYSAIYLAIQRSLSILRSEGCNKTSGCQLWVDTDLQENVNTGLAAKIGGGKGDVDPLENGGIKVTFCDVARNSVDHTSLATKTGRKSTFRSHHPQIAEEAWRSVFTSREEVSFQPFCSQPANRSIYLQDQLAD